jgi:hypothetical protein
MDDKNQIFWYLHPYNDVAQYKKMLAIQLEEKKLRETYLVGYLNKVVMAHQWWI